MHKPPSTLLAARPACPKSFLLFIIFTALFINTNVYAQKASALPKEYFGDAASKIIPGASYLLEGNNTPFPAFVRMDATAKVTFTEFFPWLQRNIKPNAVTGFQLLKTETDKLGFTHYRYVQTYRNIPIEKTTFLVHVRSGLVTSFNGVVIDPSQGGSDKAALTEAQALQRAMNFIGAKEYKWQNEKWQNDLRQRTKNPAATYFPKGELTWMADANNLRMSLAYKFDIHASNPDMIKRVYVDAASGGIYKTLPLESNCEPPASFNSIFNGSRTIRTELFTAEDFRLRDNCTSAIIRIRDWGGVDLTNNATEIQNTTNTWTTQNERFGATVLWLTNEAYSYWLNMHGRNSYNNSGGDLDGYINAMFNCSPPAGCVTANNASMSFSGGTMKVGLHNSGVLTNSYATVDIIGHEYAHAVTGSSAALEYEKESGALNESFSDIFGEANENFSLGSNDWLMGAERDNGELRNMSNPNARNDPDTYQGLNWVSTTTPADDGGDNWGVHTNSGVQNFWFYLLTVGGSGTNDNGDAYSVSGIGLADASAVAYRNLTQYLGTTSGYVAARSGAISAAIDLFGPCSDEVKQVINAWHAVGVGARAFDAATAVTSNYNGRDVSCFNACDGSATVNIISGVLPTIEWSNGATTPSVSGLCPGNYSVTITNALGLGCEIIRNVTIENTPLLTISPAVTSNYNGFGVSCNGEDDGSAAANAAGGTGAKSYLWSNGQTTANATNLSAGPYSCTVTDANGCTASGGVVVTEPPLLLATATATSNYNGYNVRCNGGSDGVAEAYPTGGVAPYNYLWSDGQTTKVATGLSATTYSCTITDANGCVVTTNSITLTEPPPLTISAGPNKIVYFGFPDSACTNLTYSGAGGGVPPYTITWSTGSTSPTINVCPETTTVYTVTILDANGCSVTDDVTVCAIDVRCGNKLDKVVICHKTGSTKNPTNTLCISIEAAENHFINHPEDQLAECGTVKVCLDGAPLVKSGPGRTAESVELNNHLEVYPNPFARSATIKFRIDKTDMVELRVFDISGKQLGIVYKGKADANKIYTVPLNAGRFAGGVYLLRLTTQRGNSYVSKIIRAE